MFGHRRAAVMDDEEWELAPENAHPKAQAALTDEYFWDCTDDNSPFGNDTGADTLAFFREWRRDHPRGEPLRFLSGLMRDWEVTDDHWDATDPAEVARLVVSDRFSFVTRDDAIIALAFGQIVLAGRVDPEVKQRALTALHRQGLPAALERSPDEYRAKRRGRLAAMAAVLQRDWE
jgi:uncharacterized protein YfeS